MPKNNAQLRGLVYSQLPHRGFVAEVTETGQVALYKILVERSNAIILDLGVPDMDSSQLLQTLFRWRNWPTCMLLTACDGVASRVQSLGSGADDCVVKSFMPIMKQLCPMRSKRCVAPS